MAPLGTEIARTWLSLLLAGGLILALVALASLLLARRIGKPIRNLTATSELLAAGQLERRAEPAGPAEVRRLGLAFNRMADQLEGMLIRQRAFVADAAHELRSPLTSLRLRIELLRDRGRDDPELQHRYLGQIEGEIERLQSTLDHLLTLAALDESKRPPRVSTDLAPLLFELADELGPLVHQAGLRLQADVPTHLPAVSVSPEQIRIAVRNLLDNAIKYTPPGGRIELRAGPADSGRELWISVADSGVGIPAEELSHVFERFYRVDRARSRRQGGTGLGLALVRSLVEAHGGQVEAASQPGQGTTFTLRLPVEAPGAGRPTRPVGLNPDARV
jgi:two-component system sensor histidine kinase BaeS